MPKIAIPQHSYQPMSQIGNIFPICVFAMVNMIVSYAKVHTDFDNL